MRSFCDGAMRAQMLDRAQALLQFGIAEVGHLVAAQHDFGRQTGPAGDGRAVTG